MNRSIIVIVLLTSLAAASCKLLDRLRGKMEPGADCPDTAATGGKLELKFVDDEGAKAFFTQLAEKLPYGSPIRLESEQFSGAKETTYLEVSDEASGRSGSRILKDFLLTAAIPAGRSVGLERIIPYYPQKTVSWRTLYLEEPASITDAHVTDAEVVIDEMTHHPTVSVTLDETGASIFAELTAKNVHRRLAIVVDGEVNSAPVIQEKIAGGKLHITLGGGMSYEETLCEAHNLARALEGK